MTHMNETMNDDPSSFECVYFTAKCDEMGGCDGANKRCDPIEHSHVKHSCIVVWSEDLLANGTKRTRVLRKDCFWAQSQAPYDCSRDECIANSANTKGSTSTYSCCCHKPRCNLNFTYVPAPPTTLPTAAPAVATNKGNELASTFIYAFLPICVASWIIILAYWLFRRYRIRRRANRGDIGFSDRTTSSLISSKTLPSPTASLKPIQLIEMVAKGRYGSIWKAKLYEHQMLAVKIFPCQDADSWVQEQEIYATPRLKEHPNVLHFIATEVRGAGPTAEYWLITEFHEQGSLYDFLKHHTLTLNDGLRMAISILRGLAFLHEEYSGNEQTYKPTIVHRDFKSKNVLVKSDTTACVADFGLAIKCTHGRPPDDILSQVGTRRYMAPEVLEGATEFTAFAFRQIDVYACALVLWELFARCSFGGERVDDYRLPFEEEVGLRPSLKDLRELVVEQKRRPSLKTLWRQHPVGSVICATIEEMWDVETEARVTAGCALERLSTLETVVSAFSYPSSIELPILSDTSPLISDYTSTNASVSTSEQKAFDAEIV